jgi:acylphosphatase
MDTQKTISVVVHGKVQGVFFRQSTQEEARRLGITGEVRNEDDGTVRITATGTEDQLSAFTEWCKKGPPRARVDRVDISAIPHVPFPVFRVTRPSQ